MSVESRSMRVQRTLHLFLVLCATGCADQVQDSPMASTTGGVRDLVSANTCNDTDPKDPYPNIRNCPTTVQTWSNTSFTDDDRDKLLNLYVSLVAFSLPASF